MTKEEVGVGMSGSTASSHELTTPEITRIRYAPHVGSQGQSEADEM